MLLINYFAVIKFFDLKIELAELVGSKKFQLHKEHIIINVSDEI